jgi:DNA-binding winged helix-turn-helix (wHTH) protein/TolB-like protein/tetratricopeptide (TPR) repeat protein
MTAMSKQKQQVYEFDNFRLDKRERHLWRDGQAVPLPSKAFDLLVVLIESKGQLVEKEELYQRVWADQVVEESNLTVQMSAIRKALGERKQNPRYIVTVAGHGYRFVGDVTTLGEDAEVMIETETLSRIVIEEEEAGEDNSAPRAAPLLMDDNGLKVVKVVADVLPRQQRMVGRLQRWTESPRGRKMLALGAVALLAGLTLAGYFLWSKQALPPAQLTSPNQIKSIAVLPFKPLVADDRNESLELGMADTLIAKLSNVREVSVRPIGAVRKYAGLDQDAVAAGREQKVDAVIDGHMQKSGEKIRVTVRLVRVEDGATLWTYQFDEKMTDIFQLQDSISERIAGVLALRLTGEEKQRLTKHHTENTEAYQLYLLGRYHLNRLTDDGFLKSLEYFQQAIEKDPNFALAHAGVASSYNALGGFNVRPPKEVYPKARSAALAALNLDPLLAQVHTELAMVNFGFDWDWAGAEREFKRALEINPSDSNARYFYSFYLVSMGQFDNAVAEMRKAQELDPVSLAKLTGLGQVLLLARRYDEALEQCRKALEMDPNLGFAHWLLGLAYMYKGSYEPAILALQKSIPLSGDSPDEPAALVHAYALSGKRTEARKILEELKQQAKRSYISPGTLADLYFLIGDKDQAFALLEKAYEERDNMVILLKVDPYFDPLRSDPRFADLVRRVGFPE